MSEKIMIETIGQIAIAITDVKRSIEFYQNVLGLQLLFEALPNLAFFQCGETRLMLTTLQGDQKDHHTSVIYYKVSDIKGTFRLLKENDCNVIREPQLTAKMPDHDLWMGFIRDPDNNLIGIMAELPSEDN